MTQVSKRRRTNGSGPNPLDRTGLCILSLDGGGVRGLSTLYILKALMTRLNHERQTMDLPVVKPYEVFDLIGGTGTGGLIAIMLGRLEMDVDACISAYTYFMRSIFDKRSKAPSLTWKFNTKARIDSAQLENAIKEVVMQHGSSVTELLNNRAKHGCRTFVYATAKDSQGITRLRSYSLTDEEDSPATICEAALATAATTFLDPVPVGTRKYVDGALGANNPVDEVEGEASNIWCKNAWCKGTGDLKPLVKCFISVGTGDPGKKPIKDSMQKYLSRTLVESTIETEKTANKFVARWWRHLDQKRYFRFDVEEGLQDIGFAEYLKQDQIEAVTAEYLELQKQASRVHNCVANLAQKRSVYIESSTKWLSKAGDDFARDVNEYIHHLVVGSLNSAPKVHYLLPLSRDPHFVGCSSQLEELEARLFRENRRKVAIHGLGGVGKTEIVLELAYRTVDTRPDYSVFWVSGNSLETFEQAYVKIGRLLQIPGLTEENADIKQLVKHRLSQESAGQWLMILDDVHDVDLWFNKTGNGSQSTALIDCLPTGSKGALVFTTRDREIAVKTAKDSVIEIRVMDEDDAMELLKIALVCPETADDHQTRLELLEHLAYLPLAIVQGAGYINTNHVSVSDYLSTMKESIAKALNKDLEDDRSYLGFRNRVTTILRMSFEQIDGLAAEYLSFMSCLDPDKIPISLLPPAGSKARALDAVKILRAYSIVTKRVKDSSLNEVYTDDPTLHLHRLMRLEIRNWLREKGTLKAWVEKAVKRLDEVLPWPDGTTNRDMWSAYLPHARHILEDELLDEDVEERFWLLEKVGSCLLADGKYGEAEGLYQKEIETRKRILGRNHPYTLRSMRDLATTYWNQERLKEAEELEVQVLKTSVEVLGQEHPDTLRDMGNLALIYSRQKRWKEAEELAAQVVKASIKIVGPEHSDTLHATHTLAEINEKQGNLYEAEALYARVLHGRELVLGPQHPDCLKSVRDLENIRHLIDTAIASDDSDATDVGSVFSVAISTLSSNSSIFPGDTVDLATDKFIELLSKDEEIISLCIAAVQCDRVGAKKFERNFRRLLGRYSVNLKKEAQDKEQKAAGDLIRFRARYIANTVRSRVDYAWEDFRKFDRLKGKSEPDTKLLIQQYTRGLEPPGNTTLQPPRQPQSQDAESDSDSEDDASDDDVENLQNHEELLDLSRVEGFMIGSTAFFMFRKHLRAFVRPSFKVALNDIRARMEKSRHRNSIPGYSRSKLSSLIAELQMVQPSHISISDQDNLTLANRFKSIVEDYTRRTWEWWPLKPRVHALEPGYVRVYWRCTCGEERWEQIPRYFAKRLGHLLKQISDFPNTFDLTDTVQTSAHPTSQTVGQGSVHTPVIAATVHGSNQNTRPVSPSGASMNPVNTPGSNTAANVNTQPTTNCYVLLGVTAGHSLRLAQIGVQSCKDDQFFEQLRRDYTKHRGLLRRWFGIWEFAHCDFLKFEKFDDHDFAPLGQGMPEPTDQAYQYKPKPIENMPPVSAHEFRRRFYTCGKAHSILHYFHQCKNTCKKACRPSREAVDRIPKRVRRLEEGGDAREVFWGILAVESLSSIMVATYHILVLFPPLVFWFLWLFRWGHSGDLQNASVPFFSALGLLSIFWLFPLLERRV